MFEKCVFARQKCFGNPCCAFLAKVKCRKRQNGQVKTVGKVFSVAVKERKMCLDAKIWKITLAKKCF